MTCIYCGEELEINTAFRCLFEDRLTHFDMGLNRYSKLCKKSPNKRHDY